MAVVTRPTLLRAAGIGVFAGGLSGLFGVGGGILIVPALVVLLGFDQRLAHGTSLTAIVPISAGGVLGFAVRGEVDWAVAGAMAVGAIAGAPIGAAALRRLPVRALRVGFAALLVVTAVRMVLSTPDATGRDELDALLGAGLAGTGLLSGVLAGLMGVGGGIIMVPAQVLLFDIPDTVAKGTSLAVIIPTAVVATWRNIRHRTTDVPTGLTLGIAGTLSAAAMAQVAIGLDATVSAVLFALLLVATATHMLLRMRRPSVAPVEEP